MPCYVGSRSACISLLRAFAPAVTLKYGSSCYRSPSFAARREAITSFSALKIGARAHLRGPKMLIVPRLIREKLSDVVEL